MAPEASSERSVSRPATCWRRRCCLATLSGRCSTLQGFVATVCEVCWKDARSHDTGLCIRTTTAWLEKTTSCEQAGQYGDSKYGFMGFDMPTGCSQWPLLFLSAESIHCVCIYAQLLHVNIEHGQSGANQLRLSATTTCYQSFNSSRYCEL